MLRRGRGRPPHPDILTPAEWRVLREIRTGATNAEIADRLGLGLATVRFHIRNIRSKLGLTGRAELVAWRGEPQPEGQPATRRRMLAPIGLLVGFWKPVVGGIAITVVGGSAIAAGVLAYTIVNDGEPPTGLGDEPASEATVSPTPPTAEATASPAAPPPPATATPIPTDTPAATTTPTAAPTTEAPSPEAGEEGEPTVTFWGNVPEAEQVTLRNRVADVVQFFGERFGVRVADVSINIASDDDAFESALDQPADPSTRIHRALYTEGSLFVHAGRTADWIERFYFEAFADEAAGDRDKGPEWLREGSAEYAAHLFRHWSGEKLLADASALWRWAASYDDTPLQALERQSPTALELTGRETLSTATLAVEWLVERAGEDALVAYYQALPTSESWEETFENAFGLSPQSAYQGFAAYRAEVLTVRRTVTGHVLGSDGARLLRSKLFIYASHTDGSGSEGTSVQGNGDFTLRPPDSSYRLRLTMVCPGSSGELGWYEAGSGFTTDESRATIIVVDGEDVSGIEIRLPAAPEELAEGCGATE